MSTEHWRCVAALLAVVSLAILTVAIPFAIVATAFGYASAPWVTHLVLFLIVVFVVLLAASER